MKQFTVRETQYSDGSFGYFMEIKNGGVAELTKKSFKNIITAGFLNIDMKKSKVIQGSKRRNVIHTYYV
jgi:hypothetical protein